MRADVLIIAVALSVAAVADPMRPHRAPSAAAPSAPGKDFAVTAVFHSPTRQTAIVNGKLVAEGDLVDGARVMAIHADGVALDYRGRAIEERLPGARQGRHGIKIAR